LSQSGRSVTSQGSFSWRPDEHPIPALPSNLSRGGRAPGRSTRAGSDAASFFGGSRRPGPATSEEFEGKTPSEEALRVVFQDFRKTANLKVSRICARPLTSHPSLPAFLEAGVDLSFDLLITSLAHCGRRHARIVLDLLHSWTRSQSEAVDANEVRSHIDGNAGLQMRFEETAAILSSRKTLCARYIFNRAVIEVVKLTPKDALGEELAMHIEQNAFNAYRNEKLEDSGQLSHRKAVAALQVELLGELSKSRCVRRSVTNNLC
jgi:hypothetical protein